MKDVSIIVPIYNCKEYLDECFRSIINQTYKNTEVILVNDGSTDGSDKVCSKYSKKYNWTFINRKENKGLSYTRNEGVKNVSTKYVMFLDSDDILYEDAVEKLLNNIKKTNASVVVSRLNSFNSSGEYDYYSSKYIDSERIISLKNNEEILNCISVCGKLYEIGLLKNIVFLEGTYHEDNYFSIKVFLNSKKISLLPSYTYYRRIREGTNKSIMQILNLRTFNDLLNNFKTVINDEVVYFKIYNFMFKKLNNYIINNLNKDEQNKALLMFKKFVRDLYDDRKISKIEFLYVRIKYFFYFYLGSLYKELCSYVKKY